MTSFASSLRKTAVPIGLTLLVALSKWPFRFAVIPYLAMTASWFLHSEPGETRWQFWTKFVVVQIVQGGTILAFASVVLSPIFGLTTMSDSNNNLNLITGYHALFLYLPTVTIVTHDRSRPYGPFGTFVLRYLFDAPLVAAGYVCREFLGLRLMAPCCTIVDDSIVQGSMPFPSDIATLAAEPYNVGMVVNMCREWKGAVDEMKDRGIVQIRLPTQDTTAVSYESLVEGCAAIRDFRAENPRKRVYVHCKGGIGRASTMTLAHYIVNEREDPSVALSRMKSKRPVVYLGVAKYEGVVRLNEERLERLAKRK